MQNQSPKKIRSCFEEAETQNTCIPYRTLKAPPMVSYQMPHNFHLFPVTTSETKNGYSLTHRGVGKDISKKQQRKKTRELEIAITWFFFFSFSRTGDTKTLELATTFWERNPTFSKRFLKTLKTYSEEPKNIQIFEKLRPFNVVLTKQRPRTFVSHPIQNTSGAR